MSKSIQEKNQKIRHNETRTTNIIAALSFDKIFGSIPTAHSQKIKYGKWGLKSPLSKWY